MDSNLREAVARQREQLAVELGSGLRKLAKACREVIGDRAALERRLAAALGEIANCKHLFVLDAKGVQIVDNITRNGPDPAHFGRDRSGRPYMQGIIGTTDFTLSEAYISRNRRRPMLTAVQVIRDEAGALIGFLGADYDLSELPATKDIHPQSAAWRQIKGDPAIRGGLFAQTRAQSQMDDHLDDILSVVRELMTGHGVYHAKLHFSSSRATIWLASDPFSYRLLEISELLDPDICLAYPAAPYHPKAIVPQEQIMPVLRMFAKLRFADETIYLRSGSLNICNGLVSLNFSCDGTHYVPYDELLGKGLSFWLGAQA